MNKILLTKEGQKWTGTIYSNQELVRKQYSVRFEMKRNGIAEEQLDDDTDLVVSNLFIENNSLYNFDGCFYLPKMALDMLKELKIKVDDTFYELYTSEFALDK